MSKGTNWTLADANKNKLVLVGDKLVKSNTLVADKVEKISPSLNDKNSYYLEKMGDDKQTMAEEGGEPFAKALMFVKKHKHELLSKNPQPISIDFVPQNPPSTNKVEKIKYENFAPIKDSHKFTFDTQEVNINYLLISFTLPNGDVIKPLFTFDITPCPAPRMTVSDKWKTDPNHINPSKRPRACVRRYFEFASNLRRQCEVNGYNLTRELNILFVVPMADTWSKKRKALKNGRPHVQRPDWDNLAKAFCDSLSGEDNFVWNVRVIKIWGETGKIIIF